MVVSKKNYTFQVDWFSEQIPWWEEQLARLKGKPNLHFLEIGSFEGRSAVWLLENILTDVSSSLTCIDTFGGSPEHENTALHISEIEKHFRHNIKECGSEGKVIVKKGFSRDILPTLMPNLYDCIYIDGSHKAFDVLEDAVLSKLLLKKGGIIIFDDYIWDEGEDELNRPKMAIDAFLNVYKGQYDLLYKGKQMIVKFM